MTRYQVQVWVAQWQVFQTCDTRAHADKVASFMRLGEPAPNSVRVVAQLEAAWIELLDMAQVDSLARIECEEIVS